MNSAGHLSKMFPNEATYNEFTLISHFSTKEQNYNNALGTCAKCTKQYVSYLLICRDYTNLILKKNHLRKLSTIIAVQYTMYMV